MLNVEKSNTLSKDLLSASKPMDHHDVELSCGGEVFPCHKFMLAARSSVFRAMFDHNLSESRKNMVDIQDANPQSLSQFLQFLYTDTFDADSVTSVLEVLSMAEKYDVQGLKDLCTQLLIQNMSVDHLSDIARTSHIYNNTLLKNEVIAHISLAAPEVVKTDGWKQLLLEEPDVCADIICCSLQINRLEKQPPGERNIPSTLTFK